MTTTSSWSLCYNNQDRIGWSPLHSAAADGQTECVKSLLQAGVDVNIVTTRDEFTCLHLAAYFGHIEVVNLLLHGKSPRRCLDEWDPSIPRLSSEDRWKLMGRQSSLGLFTALHMAVIGCDDALGATIAASILEAYRTAILEWYGLESNPKMEDEIDNELWLDYLFQIRNLQDGNDRDHSAALNPPSQDGDDSSPWQSEVDNLVSYGNRSGSELRKKLGGQQRYEGLVKSYVRLVSYSNAGDKMGRIALHYAAWWNKVEVVKFLTWDTQLAGADVHYSQLGSVANVNTTDMHGYTPLHMASRNGSTNVAKVLLGDDVVAKDIKLIPRQNLLVKKMCLQVNAASQSKAKNIQDEPDTLGNGAQLLLPPSAQNHPFRFQDTVWDEKRADVTPLHYAIEKEHTDIVELLVEHRDIDVFQCNCDGQSPWMIAFPPRLKLDKTTSEIQPLTSSLPVQTKDGLIHGSGLLPQWWRGFQEWKKPITNDSRPLTASTSFAMQRLLRSGSKVPSWREENFKFEKHQLYRQRLLRKAVTLAGEVDEEDPNIDAVFQFLVLETQIFVTFIENITGTMGPYEKPPSTMDKHLKLIGHMEKKKAAREDEIESSVWEDEIESYSCWNSDTERISLLHVAAFEGWEQELQQLLKLKRFKERVNHCENITGFGYTALHFATMNFKPNTCALAVLLKEETLMPTKRNQKGETSLRVVENALSSDRSWPLVNARELLMARPEVKQFVEDLHKERTIYAHSASALLVGAALFTNTTYQFWFAQAQKMNSDTSFGDLYTALVATSMSFCSSLAAMFIAAATALPPSDEFIEMEMEVFRIQRRLLGGLAALGLSITVHIGSAISVVARLHYSTLYWAPAILLIVIGWFVYRIYRAFGLFGRKEGQGPKAFGVSFRKVKVEKDRGFLLIWFLGLLAAGLFISATIAKERTKIFPAPAPKTS